ncbi:hypothetical protein [Actinokineospora pegani]|uniref:hypothetical protein n=1 Tax=Actinokineospora pegani TaxID=2654637 RepID=UPI0012EAB0D8|nr:hypothetical protein [Actinokineospora pegani]
MVVPAWARRLSAAWLVVLTLVTAGCTGPVVPDGDEPSLLVVSYRDAVHRLAVLDAAEAPDQLRDWARLGLASSLGLSRDQVVDALYETAPVRDPAFAELIEQPVGPGRGLFDGHTLHILVPKDDEHESRTIGLILDQHRTDAGADPAMVQLHRYQVRPEREDIELVPEPPTATADLRRDHGWREARVDQPQGLVDFLADAGHLSRLETRGAEVWAGGWHWQDAPQAPITADDVAVLQRGYDQRTGTLPGFSLDPRRAAGVDDVRAAIPGLAPGIPEAIFSGNWTGTDYASATELVAVVEKRLFQQPPPADAPTRGLPADRVLLWALLNVLEDRPLFSQARYDGGLEGTEVGMSLFYADLTAKLWVTGVGSGTPTSAVSDFVPNRKAPTPPSLCSSQPRGESGRLWFGQSDAAFASSATGVDIGAQATRLFTRSNGADGAEGESSYGFGRALRFWDRHYLEIADYEPQYRRLEQVMRWSGALEWLTASSGARLPVGAHGADDPGSSFADWYARHDELRERAPLTLVTPPSAQGEAVLPVPSETTSDCGLLTISGGVSLADRLARAGDTPSGTAALPPGTRRADPIDPAATRVDPATGSQRFERVARNHKGEVTDRLAFDLRRGPDATSARIVGGHSDVTPFAGAPLAGKSGNREFRTEFRSDGRGLVVDATYQDASAATVRVREVPTSGAKHRQTDIVVQNGQLERLREVVKRVEENPRHGLDDAPGLNYQYQGPQGQTVYRFDNAWIEVGRGPTSSRVLTTSEVATPSGIVTVRLVVPERLTRADLSALRVVEESTARAADIPAKAPAGGAVYRADSASVLGPERPDAIPEAIPSETPVKIIVATTVNGAGRPLSVRAGSGWFLTDFNSSPEASPSGAGAGGAPGSGLLGVDHALHGLGGLIVLVTVCSQQQQQSQPSPMPQSGEPQAPQLDEVCR